MADPIRVLLDYIVEEYAVQDEQKEIDLNATAAETGSAIESEKFEAAEREKERAAELENAFRQGLVAAYRAGQSGAPEILLDDRDPDEDRMADALIGFLVSYDLASSRTLETVPQHYRYSIAVHWDRLREVAHSAGVDLDHALTA